MIESGTRAPLETTSAPAGSQRARRRTRSGFEVSERRRKLFRYGLAAGIALLLVNAIVGENGYLAGIRARRDRAALAAEVAKVQQENRQLSDLGKRLKDDPATIEDAARRELGLVRAGETLVIVRDGKPAGK